jgi:hypothetical protein
MIRACERHAPTFFIICAFAAPIPVLAQESPAAQAAAGYSHLANPNLVMTYGSDETGHASHSGWFAEVIGRVAPHVGVIGQVSATYTSGTVSGRAERTRDRAYLFLGGSRVTGRCCGVVVPFGQVMAGLVRLSGTITGSRSSTITDVTSAFVYGGGADIRMGSGPVGLHVAADVFRLRDYGQGSGSWRMLVGITGPMR